VSRYADSPEGVVRVSKRGFEEWEATLGARHLTLNAKLVPLADRDGEIATVESPPTDFLTVVPLRLGIHKVGEEEGVLESSEQGKVFEFEFLQKLSRELMKRFGSAALVTEDAPLAPSAANAIWSRIGGQLAGVRVEKLGYHPRPVRLDIDARDLGSGAKAGAALALLRAEGSYVGTGTKVARGVVQVVVTTAVGAGAAAGAAAAGAAPVIVGAPPPLTPLEETVVGELYVVHPWTKELLWIGRAAGRGRYTEPGVVDGVVARLVSEIPSRFVGESDEGEQRREARP
jgi:hypothetical protein